MCWLSGLYAKAKDGRKKVRKFVCKHMRWKRDQSGNSQKPKREDKTLISPHRLFETPLVAKTKKQIEEESAFLTMRGKKYKKSGR